MPYTEQNIRILNGIIAMLSEEGCTIEDAECILTYATRCIKRHSTVQPYEEEYVPFA